MEYRNIGFTLIETLVFVSILSLFFVLAAAVTTATIRNTANAERKVIATHYAEELMDWVRYQKEANWTEFTDKATGTTLPWDALYCFDSSPITAWASPRHHIEGDCAATKINNTIYNRWIALYGVTDPNNVIIQVNARVEVSWSDGINTYTVPLQTIFVPWE